MPSLPLTANGKVARERLPAPTREHYARATASGNGNGNGSSPHERSVIEAFEAVLDLRPVEPRTTSSRSAAHSLLALSLCAEVGRRTGARLAPATIFAAPTPRALAAALPLAAPNEGGWDTMVELRGEGSRAPLFVVTAGDGNPLAFAALTRRLDPRCRSTRCSRAGSTAARRSTAASPCSRRATCARSAAASRTART